MRASAQRRNPPGGRLIAFGSFAGKAGMVDCFHGLGARLLSLGYSTPFLNVAPTYTYASFASACDAVAGAGAGIRRFGLPAPISPFVVAVAGGGNVSRGVNEVLRHLGDDVVRWVDPSELPELSKLRGTDGPHRKLVYGCQLPAEFLVSQPLALCRCCGPPFVATAPSRGAACDARVWCISHTSHTRRHGH